MSRGLIRSTLVALIAAAAVSQPRAAGAPTASSNLPILQRFLALDDPPPSEYRALRHLDAGNDTFEKSAWMDVWTEAGRDGVFRYRVVSEGGPEYIRSRVFLASLETERKLWASGAPDRAALTAGKYAFEDRGERSDVLSG